MMRSRRLPARSEKRAVPQRTAQRFGPDEALQYAVMRVGPERRTDAPGPPLTPSALVALQRTAGNRATTQMVQRKIAWHEGERAKTVDLTGTVTNFRDFGSTPAVINTEEFPGGDASAAIYAPSFTFKQTPGGRTVVTLASEAVNIVSYRMELPKAAPWATQVGTDQVCSALDGQHMSIESKSVRDAYAAKQAGKDAHAQTWLTVRGLPDDAAFAAGVEAHENHHVEEIKSGMQAILKPWDERLHELYESKAPMEASDQAEACNSIYEFAGGTPQEIGQQLVDDLRSRGEAFHKTKAGSSPTIERLTSPQAGHLNVYWKHPV